MSGISGDFGALKELQLAIAKVASPAGREAVVRVCSEAAVKVLDDEFRGGHDPYGKPWPKLRSRVGQPLRDTGTHLQNTLTPRVTPSGFVITTAFVGAAVHQYGATIKAKKGKRLVFRAGGARPRGHGKGQTGGLVFAKQVKIPQRQYMPEGEPGPLWSGAIGAAADTAVRDMVGQGT